MNDRKLMEMALDVLDNHTAIKHIQQIAYRDEAINALCKRLEQPDWVGLTDKDIAKLRCAGAHSVSDKDFALIETRLREKNT